MAALPVAVPPPAPPDIALLRGILDAAPARVCVVGRDFRYRYVNREFADFAGRPAAAIIGLTTRELVGEAVAARLDPFAFAALDGETVVRQGWVDYQRNGRRFIHWVFTPLRDAEGEVTDFIVFMRDLTEHREREEELARRNAYLQAILNGVADAVVVDRDGRLVMCNHGFVELLDLPEALAEPGTPMVELVRHRHARGMYYPNETPGEAPEVAAARHWERIPMPVAWRRRSFPSMAAGCRCIAATSPIPASSPPSPTSPRGRRPRRHGGPNARRCGRRSKWARPPRFSPAWRMS